MTSALRDTFNRSIRYLRLSVTDRCDFRCTYCMAEDMQFLTRKEVLSLEELSRVARVFVSLGVKKIRITGGEPLIRQDVLHLIRAVGALDDLEELCLTTNGSRLHATAADLRAAGVQRLNISLDSLNPLRFKALTRHGNLDTVRKGIDRALNCGFDKVKINTVVMRNHNLDEAEVLARFALERGMDISFIEEMPLGEISSHARDAEFISSAEIREQLSAHFDLIPSDHSTGGPSRYWRVAGYDGKIGFISPHSDNFCASCNRVRVTASGRLLLCLGNEHSVDLKALIRDGADDNELRSAIIGAMQIKPEKHEFDLEEAPQILRFMNATGG